jgi:hypothetical protein
MYGTAQGAETATTGSCERTNEPASRVSVGRPAAKGEKDALDERWLGVATRVANVDDERDPAVVEDGLRSASEARSRHNAGRTHATKVDGLEDALLREIRWVYTTQEQRANANFCFLGRHAWVRDGARARLAGPRVQNTGRQRVAPSGRCRTALSFVSLDRWQHPPFLAFLYTARFCEGPFLESPECPQAPSDTKRLTPALNPGWRPEVGCAGYALQLRSGTWRTGLTNWVLRPRHALALLAPIRGLPLQSWFLARHPTSSLPRRLTNTASS